MQLSREDLCKLNMLLEHVEAQLDKHTGYLDGATFRRDSHPNLGMGTGLGYRDPMAKGDLERSVKRKQRIVDKWQGWSRLLKKVLQKVQGSD